MGLSKQETMGLMEEVCSECGSDIDVLGGLCKECDEKSVKELAEESLENEQPEEHDLFDTQYEDYEETAE